MMTVAELDEFRSMVEDKHKHDIAAIDHVRNLLLRAHSESRPNLVLTALENHASNQGDPNARHTEKLQGSIIDGIASIVRQHQDRTWTAQQLKRELDHRGYDLRAKNPIATIGISLKKLSDRGNVNIVRIGSGREPHIYQWTRHRLAECEADPVESRNELVV